MNVHTFLGEIRMWAGDKAPGSDWAICDGRLLSTHDYHMLFMIIGTIYGGDGVENFAVPDLRGRIPVHIGNAQGTVPLYIGQPVGAESSTVSAANIPAHNHRMLASSAGAATKQVKNAFLANTGAAQAYTVISDDTKANRAQMSAKSVASTGGPTQISIVQPFQSINFIIALDGQYVGPQLH